MDILKSISFRIIDLAIVWMLLYGQNSWSQFALFACYVFAVVAFIGFLAVKKETVGGLPGKTRLGAIVGWAFHLLYTAALIQSDHPILAGFYLLAFFLLRTRVSDLRKEIANATA